MEVPKGFKKFYPGDVVLKIAGKTVINTSQLLNAVASLKPQSEATIGIQRGTESLTLNVTVVQRPKGLANGRR
jgi:S1-C subfamily serine protease